MRTNPYQELPSIHDLQDETYFDNVDHHREFGIAATSLCDDGGIGQEGL